MTTTWKSPRKLDSLPVDASVKFEGMRDRWRKRADGRWAVDWYGISFSSASLVNYNDGRPFTAALPGTDKENPA